ncbi:MAG TPA: alpha-amylase family glycosyl hydrolase [bacterium]|nr:alpha-amylase family glycosyl hydrolase [bacterium]
MLTQKDVIYFIVTDRFFDGDPKNNLGVDRANPTAYHGGDFAGIIKKIPYLKHLGVTALWITPVYENLHLADRGAYGYHGYWPLDFEKVDPHLYTARSGIAPGSMEYVGELSDRLKEGGIKLVLDMVVNHVGYNHPALRNDPATPIRSHWFNTAGVSSDVSEQDGWMMGLPDLDQDNPEVVDYCIGAILRWIREGRIDSIRMDTAKNVERAFWQHFKTKIKGRHPDVSLLGEVLENDISRLSEFQQHFAFDSLFDFPLQRTMSEVFIRGNSFTWLASPRLSPSDAPGVLDGDTYYTNHNRLVTLLDNHDLPARFFTEALRATGGDRPAALKMLRLALSFLMTTRGIPQIYYGTEVALEGGGDPDNRRDMPWELFAGDKPKAQYPEARETFDHLRRLIAIRKENEALTCGSLITLYVDRFVYAVLREFDQNVVVSVFNNGADPMPETLQIPVILNPRIAPRIKGMLEKGRLTDLLGGLSARLTDGCLPVRLDGRSAAIFRLE